MIKRFKPVVILYSAVEDKNNNKLRIPQCLMASQFNLCRATLGNVIHSMHIMDQ